jgi:hypothetical protein
VGNVGENTVATYSLCPLHRSSGTIEVALEPTLSLSSSTYAQVMGYGRSKMNALKKAMPIVVSAIAMILIYCDLCKFDQACEHRFIGWGVDGGLS